MSLFTLKKEMKCAHCGYVTVQYTQPNTVFGGSDLDTRPAEHPSPDPVYRCAQCGYCAYDLSERLPGMEEVQVSADYQAELVNQAYPELMQNHLCLALLYEHAQRFVDAGWVYVGAAWLSDDAGQNDRTKAYRLQAVTRFEQAIAAGLKLSPVPGADALFLSDLLRRAEAFDRAQAYCEAGLAVVEEEAIKGLLAYEQTLLAAKDRECHTTAGNGEPHGHWV